jgi:hypothetical protein
MFELTMSSSSGVGNDARVHGIVHRRGGRGGRDIGRAGLGGRGGVLKDPLPLRPRLHFHHEITLPMGDPGCTQVLTGYVMYHITEVSDDGQPCAKKIKDTYMSQCEAIVRDNVPISSREWKGKADNPHVVPDSVKILLWDEILKHFTLPEGVEPANMKRWTLTRMATQFQKFKQQLDKDYIKKNRTPNWIEYPKLKNTGRPLWNTRKVKISPRRVHEGRKVVVRRSTTIILVEVVMHLQFPSGGRWKKTFSHKVPYQRSLIGPS